MQTYINLSETIARSLIPALAMMRTDEGLDDWETWKNTRYILTINPQAGGARIRNAADNSRILDLHDGSGDIVQYRQIPADLARALADVDRQHGSVLYLLTLTEANADLRCILEPSALPIARHMAEHLDHLADESRAMVAKVDAALSHLDDVERLGWTDRLADMKTELMAIAA